MESLLDCIPHSNSFKGQIVLVLRGERKAEESSMAKIRCAGDKSSHVSPCWQTVLSVATPPLGCSERIFTLQKLLLSCFSSLVSASTWGDCPEASKSHTKKTWDKQICNNYREAFCLLQRPAQLQRETD